MYSSKIKRKVANARRALGTELGRRAIAMDFSVVRISRALGATRQSVYNWMTGESDISPAYDERTRALLKIMSASKNADEAWGKVCKQFDLKR